MKKIKVKLANIVLNSLILGLLCIFPPISLLVNIITIIFLKNRSNLTYMLLILNLSLINFFKIPHSDYYRYFIRYYDLSKLPIDKLEDYLISKGDYFFYLSKYIFSVRNYSFFLWAFCYSLLIYIFLFLISKKMKYEKNRIYIFFLFSPFNITRFIGALTIFGYSLILVKNYKRQIFIILSWLTHKFFLISYVILLFNKIRIRIKKYQLLLFLLFIFAIGSIFHLQLVNFISNYIKISPKYYEVKKFEISINTIRGYLNYIINVLILILVSSKIRIFKFIRLNLVILILLFFISNVVFGRYLETLVFISLILFFYETERGSKRKLIILLLVFKQLIILQDNLRYSLKADTYPLRQRILKKEEVFLIVDENGSIRK